MGKMLMATAAAVAVLAGGSAALAKTEGVEITHTGFNDPDGNSCSADKLIEGLELADARAVVFTMHEPEDRKSVV